MCDNCIRTIVRRAQNSLFRLKYQSAAQVTVFFEGAAQMGIPHATVVQIQEKGIDNVDDLVDFDKDTIKQISANLQRTAGRVPDPNPAAAAGATIPTPPFVFGAKSQQRLINVAKVIWYYDTIGQNTTTENLRWTPVLKNFSPCRKWYRTPTLPRFRHRLLYLEPNPNKG